MANLGSKFCGFQSLDEGARRFNSYFERMREEFTRSGLFGAKAHFEQFQWALNQGFDLSQNFPDRFVYCTRGDIVGQAISYMKASQTRAWIHHHEVRGEANFNPEILSGVIRELVHEKQCWESFFQTGNVEPYRLSYERLCADMQGELGDVLEFLDVDPQSTDVARAVEKSTGTFKVQRDALSEEWRGRYLEYVKQRGVKQSRQIV